MGGCVGEPRKKGEKIGRANEGLLLVYLIVYFSRDCFSFLVIFGHSTSDSFFCFAAAYSTG